MKTMITLTATLLAFGASSAWAARYEVDAGHSNVAFTIKHLVSKVSGDFREFSGSFEFDPAKPESSKGEFVAKAASVNTNNAKRDEHLRSGDFFDAEKHPELKFANLKVTKGSGKDHFKATADLTLHGVTKPVALDVEYLGAAKDPWGNNKVGFVANGKFKRKDFGITWNKALDAGGFVLGEDVELNLQIEANQAK